MKLCALIVLIALYSPFSYASTCIYSEPESKNIFGTTIVTIGDSITWAGFGNWLRCKLRDKGLQYDFDGTKTDIFGFRHEGEGGDKTTDVLNRMDGIPKADAYFLLIGTNDIDMQYNETVSNIIHIALGLRQKNNFSVIYISTLLPRDDKYNERNESINNMLLSFQDQHLWFRNCYVLDAGANFSSLDWKKYMSDSVHPNEEGYDAYTGLIMESLSRI